MPWSIYKYPEFQARRFAAQAKCPSGRNTEVMLACLKGRSAQELVSIHAEFSDNLRPLSANFFPTIEKDFGDGTDFLSKKPMKILQSGKFARVPFMTGVNSAEGLMISSSKFIIW
jgi:carboxylesterase type B